MTNNKHYYKISIAFFKYPLRCFGLFLFLLSLISCENRNENEIIFAISAKPGSIQHLAAERFTELANERLQADSIIVKFFGAAQLGKDKELMQKLKLGAIDLTLPSSTMSAVSPQFAFFEMPFLIKDRDHLSKIESKFFWDKIAPTAEKKGYKVLALWENGIRHITNNERPINSPKDLSGLKLRTPKSKWRVRTFESWGANPTPMSFSEVFVGLQTGVIDGQENPYVNIWSAKLPEVQKYLSVTGHVYTPAYPTMGRKTYEKMNPKIRDILKEVAMEVAIWSREKGAAEDEKLLEKLRESGIEINVGDRTAFVAASADIYTQYAADFPEGKALIEEAKKLEE